MTARDGWTPGQVRIAMSEPGEFGDYEYVAGELWGEFGLNRDEEGWFWIVTHLPTGARIASFERKTDAKRFCRLVANVTDWAAVTGIVRQPEPVRRAVIDAMHRCSAASPAAGAVVVEAP